MCASSSESLELNMDELFTETQVSKLEPPPKFLTYKIPGDAVTEFANETLSLRVVGSHSLWGNYLWNGARWMADYICRRPDEFQERRILELGAASALPSILSLLIGNASFVLATDYPSDDLIENMIYNLNLLIPSHKRNRINALGFLWGDDEFIRKVCLKTDDQSIDLSKRLGHHIEHSKYAATSSKIETKDCVLDLQESNLKFNVILLCDVVFNHSEHQKLIKSCKLALNDAGVVWVTFTHYRPWLKEKDLAFLKLAESHGFTVEHIESIVYDSFLFPEDALDPRVIDPLDLRTVHAYRLHLTPE